MKNCSDLNLDEIISYQLSIISQILDFNGLELWISCHFHF